MKIYKQRKEYPMPLGVDGALFSYADGRCCCGINSIIS